MQLLCEILGTVACEETPKRMLENDAFAKVLEGEIAQLVRESRCGRRVFADHEYLATMLGVRRPGVSVAAGALDEAGFIAYRQGRIVMRDRAGLETVACECYATVNDQVQRILGYDVRKGRNVTDSGPFD